MTALYRLKNDDPRMGLAAGDVLECEPYWLDPDKLTVLRRVSDDFDPECNVYREHVERVLPVTPTDRCPGSGQHTRRGRLDEPDRCPVCDRVAYVRVDGTTGSHRR